MNGEQDHSELATMSDTGIEPVRPFGHYFSRLARLPVSPAEAVFDDLSRRVALR